MNPGVKCAVDKELLMYGERRQRDRVHAVQVDTAARGEKCRTGRIRAPLIRTAGHNVDEISRLVNCSRCEVDSSLHWLPRRQPEQL